MKKLIVLLLVMVLCLTTNFALSDESITSPKFDPEITLALPNPGWAVSIQCEQANQTLELGTKVILTAAITTEQPDYYSLSEYNVSYNWQAKAPGGEWTFIGSEETYEFNLDRENVNWIFKVTVTLSKK